MIEQFFGKEFKISISVLAGLLAFSLVSYVFNLGSFFLVIFAILIFIITLRNLHYGLAIVFLELFSNPHGHMFFYDIGNFSVSLRMVVFVAVMSGWFILLLTHKIKLPKQSPWLIIYLPLLIAILLGFITGLSQNNPIDAIKDGNAYLYTLYLFPVLSVKWNSIKKKMLLQVLTASVVVTSFTTITVLYLYTHFTEMTLRYLYIFIRDIRLVEVTNVSAMMYRVFIQSQMFSIIFAFMLAGLLLQSKNKKNKQMIILLLSLCIAIMLLSLSRSFWFGSIIGVFVFVYVLSKYVKPKLKEVGKTITNILISTTIALSLIGSVVLFPFPQQRVDSSDLSDLFGKRGTNLSDSAISSRWKLLDPMNKAISNDVILGNGFGKKITFISDDPRVRSLSPDGEWSTYSMEWGWQELLLKMGVLGPMSFILILMFYVKSLVLHLKTERQWLSIGLISSLFFLYGTHVFSPYLNHPMGIGFLLFVIPFLSDKELIKFGFFERLKKPLITKVSGVAIPSRTK